MRRFAITFEVTAARQIDEARGWLEANRGASRVSLLDDELARALRLLETCPDMYAPAPGSKTLRRLRLEQSGYHVYYRVFHRQEHIYVVRFWHERRPL